MGPLPSPNVPFISDSSMQDAGWAAYHLLGPAKTHGEGQVLCSRLGAVGCEGKLDGPCKPSQGCSWKHGKVIMDNLTDCGRNQKILGTHKEV